MKPYHEPSESNKKQMDQTVNASSDLKDYLLGSIQ